MRTGSVSREDIAESVLYVDDGKMGISRIHKAHTLLMKAQTLIKEPEAQSIVRRVVELLASAQTDLLGGLIPTGAHIPAFQIQDEELKRQVSQEELELMESALQYVTMTAPKERIGEQLQKQARRNKGKAAKVGGGGGDGKSGSGAAGASSALALPTNDTEENADRRRASSVAPSESPARQGRVRAATAVSQSGNTCSADAPPASSAEEDGKDRKRSRSVSTGRRARRRGRVRASGQLEASFISKVQALRDTQVTGATEKILSKVDSWDEFDVWELDRVSDGRSLSVLFMYLLDRRGLFQRLSISRALVGNFIRKLEDGYLDNPYHNRVHGADVLHASHFFLESKLLGSLADKHPLMRLSVYMAAAAHDYKHPGTNNAFAKNTSAELALVYNDESILENMHVSEMFRLLRNSACNFLSSVSTLDYKTVRRLVISMVLHTDMAKHGRQVVQLRNRSKVYEKAKFGWLREGMGAEDWFDEAEMLLCAAVHCGDLGNPCRPTETSVKWSMRVLEEFWRQGDMEKDQLLPVGPGHDRLKANIPVGQTYFIRMLVSPLYKEWCRIVPEAAICEKYLQKNLDYWVAESKQKGKTK